MSAENQPLEQLADRDLVHLELPVRRAVRNYPPHASARVRHIARTPWYYVDVRVRDCLACGLTGVNASVEARESEFLSKGAANTGGKIPHGKLFFARKSEKV